ncbi:MAG: flavin reductase family protein [Burkholderiaceae bacterium]
MTPDIHFYEPKQGHGLPHDPFNAIIGPRPIGWISSRDADGQVNLAPYSFFNAFNYRPPIIGFSSIGRKDTIRNVEAHGEFAWSLATRALARSMNATAAAVAPEVDEFELAGLDKAPSRLIDVPRVAGSPASMECKVVEIIQLHGADGVLVPSWLVLGEVVAVHIDKAYLKDGVYQTALAEPILRAGGAGSYAHVTPPAMFEMPRPD